MSEETSKIVEAFVREVQALCDVPPGRCVCCGADEVVFNGTHTRSASRKILGAVVHIAGIIQRRLRCRSCRERWTRRPPEILARVHYQACVIASAVVELAAGGTTTAVASAHECDRRTVRRFVDRIAIAGDPAEVARELMELVDEPVLPAVPIVERTAALAPKTAQHLLRAMSLLVLLEVLGSVRGQEPPALGTFLRERATPIVIPRDAQRQPRIRDPPSTS